MADVQSGFAPINGANLYYEVAGQGHPLLLLHAGVADSSMWDDQFGVFAEQYRTIRYDMRGYGKSEPVEGTYTNRDDLYALLKFLSVERTHLIGCSMGGGTCMDFALEHREMASALIMVASGPTGLDLGLPPPDGFEAIEAAEAAKDWDRMAELETHLWFDGSKRTSDQVDQAARARLLAMNRRAIEHAAKQLGTHVPPLKPSAADRLNQLQLPVLVIYGDRDVPYIQGAALYMGENLPNAQRALMIGTAHLPNMERPTEFNHLVLNFLKQL